MNVINSSQVSQSFRLFSDEKLERTKHGIEVWIDRATFLEGGDDKDQRRGQNNIVREHTNITNKHSLSLHIFKHGFTFFDAISKFKDISTRNNSNKSKQIINHKCGRKSFQAVSFEKIDLEILKETNFQDLWKITHTNNNGEWVDEASRELHMKVQQVALENLEGISEEIDKDQMVGQSSIGINNVFKSNDKVEVVLGSASAPTPTSRLLSSFLPHPHHNKRQILAVSPITHLP
ncbi:hypothetical protein Fmac_026471 [Flemingia macrophylla]|uniref:Uncharacterized protein n=1 Tax=Flemingia macrophylla TaxID=520843 RepID=A0ABD1LEY1_9FABA